MTLDFAIIFFPKVFLPNLLQNVFVYIVRNIHFLHFLSLTGGPYSRELHMWRLFNAGVGNSVSHFLQVKRAGSREVRLLKWLTSFIGGWNRLSSPSNGFELASLIFFFLSSTFFIFFISFISCFFLWAVVLDRVKSLRFMSSSSTVLKDFRVAAKRPTQ